MKLELALLCVEMDCQEVFESTGSGYCPSCGSGVALPMSQILNRDETAATILEDAPETPFRPVPLRLVVPDRQLDAPETILRLSHAADDPTSPRLAETAEGAELKDFRLYLEARLAEIEPAEQDASIGEKTDAGLLAQTG